MYVVLKAQSKQDRSEVPIFLDSSMVEHSAVNRGVVGSSPIRGVFLFYKGIIDSVLQVC